MKKNTTKQTASYMTLTFALLAFAQSGQTMAELAHTVGKYPMAVAWITPFLIDGALIQLGMSRLALGKNAPKWMLVAIAAAIVLSIVLNCAAHGALGAIAPIMLAVSFESWVKLAESPAAKGARTKTARAKSRTATKALRVA